MSQFYKPNRNPDWNFGGARWRLSRSKIDLFLECPKCFYIDNKLGVARPPGYPFNLNSAVDELLKKEFDVHRVAGTEHPLVKSYGVKAVPFQHPKMDEWRDSLRAGVQCKHKPTGMTISGGVDDIWVNPEGELMVVDYKATSKEEAITELNDTWHIGYKRQMEVYQWLLRQNDFKVSNTGYFVYANGRRDKEAFDGKLEFEVALIAYKGNDDWVEGTLNDIYRTLTSEMVPPASPDCDYCRYRGAVEMVSGKGKEVNKLF